MSIDQAISYISAKVGYDFTISNLKELQAFGYINTVFYYEGLAKFSVSNVDAYCSINGYFKLFDTDNLISDKPIYFETCFLALAANEYVDSYGDITISLIPHETDDAIISFDRTDKIMKVNPYEYNFRLTQTAEDFEIVEINTISPNQVRINKSEIDNWLRNDDRKSLLVNDFADDEPTHHKSIGSMQALLATLIKMAEYDKSELADPYGELNKLIQEKAEILGLSVKKDFIAKWLKKADEVL